MIGFYYCLLGVRTGVTFGRSGNWPAPALPWCFSFLSFLSGKTNTAGLPKRPAAGKSFDPGTVVRVSRGDLLRTEDTAEHAHAHSHAHLSARHRRKVPHIRSPLFGRFDKYAHIMPQRPPAVKPDFRQAPNSFVKNAAAASTAARASMYSTPVSSFFFG